MTGPRVAYFSMEIALESAIPTYAGGLGVLAGDTLRAAADLGLPLVGVSLVHRQGYFRQHLEQDGTQRETPAPWLPQDHLDEMPPRVSVTVENRPVSLRAWRYVIQGVTGAEVPVYLLDALLPENGAEHRDLTDQLYGGDDRYRLCQEALLGMGGVAMLDALGHGHIRVFHMNEGHSALLALALLEQEHGADEDAVQAVRKRCVFTTHTPVPAGRDQFSIDLAQRVLGTARADRLMQIGCCLDSVLNMTHVGLFFSHYINGVAMRHRDISRGMFPGYPIASITNGVHGSTWAAPAFQEVFDHHIPDWRFQNENLRYGVGIPTAEIQAAHARCKAELLAEVERRSQVHLLPDRLTLGFARRATPYKRADMLVSDIEGLRRVARMGPLQIIYAGKAHPHDAGGKEMIRRVVAQASHLRGVVDVVYLENYDMDLARLLCSGVDVWVNTPQQPQEASGTSGMKAAINGVPSLSVLDGWWIEGHVEGITGWSIGDSWDLETDPSRERRLLGETLEEIASLFYRRPDDLARVMRHSIALNGSFFNAQRMIEQYAQSAYHLGPTD
jgi:glycogen phosphorylase